jgi:hypothetical protein
MSFKRVTPAMDPGQVLALLVQFPHCDQRVLHAPGECVHCDHHPEWQALRIAWGIAFTGYEPDDGELPCPATTRRSVEKINRWGGNRPRPDTTVDDTRGVP